jgi:hypothetical protein
MGAATTSNTGGRLQTSGLYVPPLLRGVHFSRPATPFSSNDSHPHFRSIPKIDFPKFDGVCPKLWQQCCEDYFSLYGTHRSMWIIIATMQF